MCGCFHVILLDLVSEEGTSGHMPRGHTVKTLQMLNLENFQTVIVGLYTNGSDCALPPLAYFAKDPSQSESTAFHTLSSFSLPPHLVGLEKRGRSTELGEMREGEGS